MKPGQEQGHLDIGEFRGGRQIPPGVARESESRVAAVLLYEPVGSDLSPLAPSEGLDCSQGAR